MYGKSRERVRGRSKSCHGHGCGERVGFQRTKPELGLKSSVEGGALKAGGMLPEEKEGRKARH